MGLIEVADYSAGGWALPAAAQERSRYYCQSLEGGDILFWPDTPFALPQSHRSFLLGLRQPNTAHHKNISYKPGRTRVQGITMESADREKLAGIMESYSRGIAEWLGNFLLPYAGHWQVDFASFRSIEEQGRDMPVNKRNDLLHVDAFPTRPSNGNRILRAFTNLNPTEPRVWLTSDPFDVWAKEYAKTAGLFQLVAKSRSRLYPVGRRATRLARAAGIPVTDRSLYDEFMLSFHYFLKSNNEFQSGCPKAKWEFPPGSSWVVFTDMVPHAVLSGQFALEQTFIVGRDALLLPDRAPYRVLEKFSGVNLID
jgi:hypothetical protein